MAVAGCKNLDPRCGDGCYCKARKSGEGEWKAKPGGGTYADSYPRRVTPAREVRCLFPHEHRRECMCAIQGGPLIGRSTRSVRVHKTERHLVRLRVVAIYSDGTAREMNAFKVTEDDLTGFEVDGEQYLAFIARVPRQHTEPAIEQLDESELPF